MVHQATLMNSLLFISVRAGIEDITRSLLQAGCDVNTENSYGETPLLLSNFHRPAVVKLLLEAGADVHRENRIGFGPLHLAVLSGNAESVQLLLAAGVYIDLQDCNGDTPLHFAVACDDNAIAKILIDAGAAVNHLDCDFSVLSCAGKHENLALVKLLLMCGADVNYENIDGSTPLHCLAWVKDWLVVQTIVRRCDIINQEDDDGCTALHMATSEANLDMVKELLDNGANVNVRTIEDQETPLHLAACAYERIVDYENQYEIIKLLLDRGANPNARDHYEATPVLKAAQNMGRPVLQLLKERGADFAARDEDGCTILHYAVENSRTENVEYLLDSGFDAYARTNTGMTPLHYAVKADATLIVQYLLNKGLDVYVKSNNGDTPLKTADTMFIKKLLLEHMALKHSMGVEVDKEDQTMIAKDKKLKEHFDNCLEILERMKKTKVSEHVTFFEVLTGSDKKITGLAKNEELVEAATDRKGWTLFPIYFGMMWTRFYNKVQKQKKVKRATSFLDDLFKNLDPLSIASREVVKYFNDEELNMLKCNK